MRSLTDPLTLQSAFDRTLAAIWAGSSPVELLGDEGIYKPAHRMLENRRGEAISKIADQLRDEFVFILGDGSLRTFNISADGSHDALIPAENWKSPAFAEQAFGLPAALAPFVSDEELSELLEVLRSRRASAKPSEATHALSDYLRTAALDGILVPATVESLATTWGLGIIATKPLPSAHDPNDEPYWSLVMAVSWLVWRNVDLVRDVMDSFRRECSEWFEIRRRLPVDGGDQTVDVVGHELRSLEPLNLERLQIAEGLRARRGVPSKMSVNAVVQDLRKRLLCGEIAANAVDASGEPCLIQDYRWQHLEWGLDSRGKDCLYVSRQWETPAYSNVSFRRTDIMRDDLRPPSRVEPNTIGANEEKPSRKRMRSAEHDALKAWANAFPDGPLLGMSLKAEHRKVLEQLGEGQNISYSTFARARKRITPS